MTSPSTSESGDNDRILAAIDHDGELGSLGPQVKKFLENVNEMMHSDVSISLPSFELKSQAASLSITGFSLELHGPGKSSFPIPDQAGHYFNITDARGYVNALAFAPNTEVLDHMERMAASNDKIVALNSTANHAWFERFAGVVETATRQLMIFGVAWCAYRLFRQ